MCNRKYLLSGSRFICSAARARLCGQGGGGSPGGQGPALGTASRQRGWPASRAAAVLAFQPHRVRWGWHHGRHCSGTSDNSCRWFSLKPGLPLNTADLRSFCWRGSSWRASLGPAASGPALAGRASWPPSGLGWFGRDEPGASCFRWSVHGSLLHHASRAACFRGSVTVPRPVQCHVTSALWPARPRPALTLHGRSPRLSPPLAGGAFCCHGASNRAPLPPGTSSPPSARPADRSSPTPPLQKLRFPRLGRPRLAYALRGH